MDKIKKRNPCLGINLKDNYINIGSDVIRELNYPSYIRLLISERKDSIAVAPCEANDVMSFKVPDGFPHEKNKNFRIYSTGFTKELMESLDLKEGSTYRYKGEYDTRHKAMVFQLS
ncbi:MAG: hypothetical protein IJ682_00520 [Lachnospiraceae bacterium]|nr:hypothetical protein [Lachnospiraceae bacterium]